MPVLVWGWEVSVMPQVPAVGLCIGLAEVWAMRQVPAWGCRSRCAPLPLAVEGHGCNLALVPLGQRSRLRQHGRAGGTVPHHRLRSLPSIS